MLHVTGRRTEQSPSN